MPVEFVDVPTRGRVFRSHRRVHLGDVDASARLRLAAIARYLQDVATDDADDAGLSDRDGVWVVRSIDVEIVRLPWYHEPVDLTTFCSGFGPRWAERRTIVGGERGALIETVALWVYIDRERGRPLVLDEHFHTIYGEAARGRRVRGRLVHGPPSPDADARPWPLRASDFDVLDHVNNARSLEAFEDELARCLPGRVPTRAASSTAAPSNGETRSNWPAWCTVTATSLRSRCGCRSTARCGSRRPSPWIPRGEPGGRVH